MEADQKRYLELLARSFPTQELAAAEIINLSAILNLPKGTEFFCSDIHGESEAFSHILRNGSGSIRRKVDEAFGDQLTEAEKRELATLIYYPREKAKLILAGVEDERAWYAIVVPRLVAVCKRAARKYTASRVRKALPAEFAYIIEELMNEDNHGVDKEAYYAGILDAAVRTGRGIALIEALAQLIQRLAISQLHIIGDIYDRGPQPDVIMETLSIIAYRQPVTKMEIGKIRGVNSDHAVNRLVEYGLVYEAGRLDAPGRPALFATTEEFLRRFGVSSMVDLPTMNPEQEEEIIQEVEEELQMRLGAQEEDGSNPVSMSDAVGEVLKERNEDIEEYEEKEESEHAEDQN